MDILKNVYGIPLAIPGFLRLTLALQFHTGDFVTDGRRTLRHFNRMRKPFVRIAWRSEIIGRGRRLFGGTFGRSQGGKTDLAADGTNDGLGGYAAEQRTQSREARADDAKGRLDGGP